MFMIHKIFSFQIFLMLILRVATVVNPLPAICNKDRGTCKPISECDEVFQTFHLIYNTIKYCNESEGIVCCPNPIQMAPVLQSNRKFERKCKEYSDLMHGQCVKTPFIVNGIKAEPREFPFMALVGLKNCEDDGNNEIDWKCGGTLISHKFVLTAAHCMESNQNQKYHVRLGELDHSITTDDAQPQNFDVINQHLHPEHDDDNQFNDIALLELDTNAILNEYVMPACLPSNNGDDFSLLTATGWGRIEQAASSSSHLLKVTLNRFDNELCVDTLKDYQINERTQICAGSFNNTGDTCYGDSGGPIFVTHPIMHCMKQVIGITSYGSMCGQPNVPSVYTKVYLFIDWIEKIVWP